MVGKEGSPPFGSLDSRSLLLALETHTFVVGVERMAAGTSPLGAVVVVSLLFFTSWFGGRSSFLALLFVGIDIRGRGFEGFHKAHQIIVLGRCRVEQDEPGRRSASRSRGKGRLRGRLEQKRTVGIVGLLLSCRRGGDTGCRPTVVFGNSCSGGGIAYV